MADISQIKLPNGTTYDIKDTVARGVKMYYGTCTTAAATAAKAVTVSADQNFKLTVGALVMVKFTISNSASSVTLNVNSTGAKSIYYNNAVYTGTSTSVCGYANAHFVYMYDGTNWVWVGHGSDSNTTYSAMSVSEGQTATATSARSMRADYLKQIIQYHAVPSGQGVPAGGTAGQVLAKVDGTDYNTGWIDAPNGGFEFETIAMSDFDFSTIPTTEPFYWYLPKSGVSSASASYTANIPNIKGRFSRSGISFPATYIYRPITEASGSYTHFFVRMVDYALDTLFRAEVSVSYGTTTYVCYTPIPGPALIVSLSGTNVTVSTPSISDTGYKPFVAATDVNDFYTDNANINIVGEKRIASITFEGLSGNWIQVPLTTYVSNGTYYHSCECTLNYGGTLYRITLYKSGTSAWAGKATAIT